jgi:hypothetical protein
VGLLLEAVSMVEHRFGASEQDKLEIAPKKHSTPNSRPNRKIFVRFFGRKYE